MCPLVNNQIVTSSSFGVWTVGVSAESTASGARPRDTAREEFANEGLAGARGDWIAEAAQGDTGLVRLRSVLGPARHRGAPR